MPREAHIERQVQWKRKLSEYGCKVNLEKTVYIQNAPVIVDVFAEIEGKKFLIEIGDIEDKRKKALMELYSKQNENIEFIHEPYNADKTDKVLETLTAYRNSDEYHQLQITKEKEKIAKEKVKTQKTTMYFVLFFIFIIGLFYFNDQNLLFAIGWIVIWFTGLLVWISIKSAIY